MIAFNRPPYTGSEDQYVLAAMRSEKISGDGEYSALCKNWFEETLGCDKFLLTPSCTQALEMAALLIDIQPGDEVIMPSYTFVSTANAFVLRGARIVFVDVRPDTMNLDETQSGGTLSSPSQPKHDGHVAYAATSVSAPSSSGAGTGSSNPTI